MAGSHDVEVTFELTKDEIYGVVTRPSARPSPDSSQVLCYTSDGFNPLLGLEDAKISEDGSSLRLGPPLRLREPSGDTFGLPDPSRPWFHNKLHIRSAVCEPYTNFIYFGTQSAIWRLDATDMVTRVAGHRTEPGESDGPGDLARFDEPCCLAADGLGNLYVATDVHGRLARIQLPPPASVLAFTAAAAAPSSPDDPPTINDVLAVSVTTLSLQRISGKVSALTYDFTTRSLLVATHNAVYRLPTTAAGCLAAEPAAIQLIPCTAAAALPMALAPAAPHSSTPGPAAGVAAAAAGSGWTPGRAAAPSPPVAATGKAARLGAAGASGGAAATAAAAGSPLNCLEGLLVDHQGDIYVADTVEATTADDDEDDGADGESRVQLKRLRLAAEGAASAGGAVAWEGRASGGRCGDGDGDGDGDGGGGGAHCAAVGGCDTQSGGGASSSSSVSFSGGGGSSSSSSSGIWCVELVCSDLGLLCGTRLAVLPYGWLLAHDYQGNVLRLLRLGLQPSWPRGAQLLLTASPCGGRGCGGGGLAADLGALLASQPDVTSDVTVRVGCSAFPCHRVILAARCEYFRRLFASGFGDSAAREVALPDADPAAFAALLTYLYTDRTDCFPPAPGLRSVAELADRLLLPAAGRQAQRQLLAAATPTSLVDDLLWAEAMGLGDLLAALRDVFTREQGRVLLQAPDSLRRLVVDGSPELVSDLLVAAIQRAS